MAKAVMPLLGVEAHGSLKKAITYRARLDGTTVGRWKRHRDFRSALQDAQRQLFEFAVQLWPFTSEAYRDELAELASTDRLNAWNWWVKLMLQGDVQPWTVEASEVEGVDMILPG